MPSRFAIEEEPNPLPIAPPKPVPKLQENSSFVQKSWNIEMPCYEIINIEFEESSSDSDSSSSSSSSQPKKKFVNLFTSDPGHLTEQHLNSEDIGKNIILEFSTDEEENFKTPTTTGQSVKKKDKKDDIPNKIPCSDSEDEEKGKNIKSEPHPIPEDVPKTKSQVKPEQPWKCPICPESAPVTLPLYAAFKDHLTQVHQTSEKCPLCPLAMRSWPKSIAHIVKEHMSRWACASCNIGFSVINEYRDHMTTLHEREDKRVSHIKGQIRCKACKTKFNSVVRFEFHVENKHRARTCPVCRSVHTSRQRLMNHIFVNHCDCTFACVAEEGCKFQSKSPYRISEHANKSHGRERDATQTCQICRRKISNQALYQVHMKQHENEPPRKIKCDICGVGFTRLECMELHRRRHFNEEKKFPCEYCEKRFFTVHLKTVHERLHTNEKPFDCTDCQMTFRTMAKLNKHREHRHTANVKRFYCTHCALDFCTQSALNKHSDNIHGVLQIKNEKEKATE